MIDHLHITQNIKSLKGGAIGNASDFGSTDPSSNPGVDRLILSFLSRKKMVIKSYLRVK